MRSHDWVQPGAPAQEIDQAWVESDPVMESALEELRSLSYEPEEQDQAFVSQVVRRAKVERRQRSWNYWVPVLIAALAGSLALFAVVTAVANVSDHTEPVPVVTKNN